MAKILLLQTTQLQIVVCNFLANKHSIVVLQGLIYNCRKAQTKKLKLFKVFDKIRLKNKLKTKLRRRRKELNEVEKNMVDRVSGPE